MRQPSAARVLAIAFGGAVAAIAAHGGPALATDPRWLVPALAAAAGCTWAVAAAMSLAARGVAPRPWSPWTTAGLLLIAQLAAHWTLFALGVMPAAGQAGSLALHVALALAAAAALSALQRLNLSRAHAVLRALLELLRVAVPPPQLPRSAARPAPALSPRRPRGPPHG
jgi:hypothetical protein